jgi:hypothetical protein
MQTVALIRKFVVAIGIGLALASLRLDILKQWEGLGADYWRIWAPRLLLLALLAACAGLLITNVIREEGARFMASVAGLGAVLLGFFLFIPVAVGAGHLGDLRWGPRLGVLGSALIVLGALPLGALGSWQRSRERTGLPLYLTWLVAAIAPALVIVALKFNTASTAVVSPNSLGVSGPTPRYWNSVGFTGGHDLGIFMLVLAIAAIVLALGDALLKAPVLGRWALAASLVLLGVALYYPAELAFRRLAALASGGGLALEGSALAVLVTGVAVAVERGAVDGRKLSLSRFFALGGIGLALAATYSAVFGGADTGSFWVDGTLGGFPLIVIVLGIPLLLASFVVRSRWPLFSVSALGWLLVGFFGVYVFQFAPNDLGRLGPATWLGMGGGALMGLSAVSARGVADLKRRSPALTRWQLIPWLVTVAGAGALLGSLWLAIEKQPAGTKIADTYWNSAGDHSQGVVMGVLGALTLVALAGLLVTRLSVLRTWVVGMSLALLGISLFVPALEAFNHLGALRSGAWLALAGSLLASAGALALALPEHLAVEAEPEDEGEKVAPRNRALLKGKKHRVPEMRRGR